MMKGFQHTLVLFCLVIMPLASIFGEAHPKKNLLSLSLEVAVINHETCPSNGVISFNASSGDSAPISYSIFEINDLVNPIAVTEENELGGLEANTYKVIASQVIDGETISVEENSIVLDQLTNFEFTLEVTNEYCVADGSLTIEVQSGTASSFEITAGPELRPEQSSPIFLDLPAGNFVLEIEDSCGDLHIGQFTILDYGNEISISNSVNSLVACDEIQVTTYIIREGNANVIYPLVYTYVVHPPSELGLPDETVTYTLNSGSPITSGHQAHVIPFYGAGNVYTFDLTVVDGCGEISTYPTVTVNKSLIFFFDPLYDDCKNYFQLRFSQYQSPLELELLEAPAGFDPTVFNDVYPGPYTETNYGNSNPVVFQNDSISAPAGLYTFKLTDACGQEYIGSRIIESNGLKPYSPLVSTDCIEGFGNVYVYWQSDVTEINIIDAPEEYDVPLPFDVTEFMKYSDRVVIQSLPPGTYSFEAQDSCGNYSVSEVTAVAYEEYGFEYGIIPQCGSFSISLDHHSNYFSQHHAVSSINEYFILQKFDSSTNEWKNLNGTVHDPTILIGTGVYDFYQGGFALTNGGLTTNIQDSGHFRIIRVIKKATQSNEVTLENCEETLVEFDYVDDGFSFDDVYKFQCDESTYDIACVASGVGPFLHRITSFEGNPLTIENGNDPIFTDLEAGLYNVQVEDLCGNIRNRQVDLTSISFPNILADLCDDEDGSLSIISLPFLSYEWSKTSNPEDVLSEEASLTFNNFDSSVDGGEYQVRIYYDSSDACIDQTLNYDVPIGTGPPEAGNTTFEEVCNDIAVFDLTLQLDENADLNGLWFDAEDNQVFTPEALNIDNLENGTYVYTYHVQGICSGSDFSEHTLSIITCNQAPVAVCADITVNADVNCQAYLDASMLDGGSTDPDLDELVFSIDDESPFEIGEYVLTLLVSDGVLASSCDAVVVVQDSQSPSLTCQDITVELDEDGNTSLSLEELEVDVYDACGIESMQLDIDEFSCELGIYTVILTAIDNNGNESTCDISVTVTGDDADCDSVHDACDVCEGGDDTVDNNGDGLADCANPPGFIDIIDDWKCGENQNKVLVCHVPQGNPANAHTICVSKNAVDTHVGNHGGDYLGECFHVNCDNLKLSLNAEVEDISPVELAPVPATNYLHLIHDNELHISNIQILDVSGKITIVEGGVYKGSRKELDISLLENGIYFLTYEIGERRYVRKFVVLK